VAIQDIFQSIVAFNDAHIAEQVQAEIDAGTDIASILNEGLIQAMDAVGKQFGEGKLFVPEMLRAAQTMKVGLEVLRPHLAGAEREERGTVVIGTVKGDLHDIGKNLVAMLLEGAGFTIVDLGVDVEPEKFLEAAKAYDARLVAMSALLTTTMPQMERGVRLIREAGLHAKTVVGGAPVTEDFAIKISADGYGADAPSAVELARTLTSER